MSTESIDVAETDESTDLAGSMTATFRGLRESASVDRVFGEPIERGEQTVVPVARVAYGFGGGVGSASGAGDVASDEMDAEERGDVRGRGGDVRGRGGEGGGVGGGMVAQPLGALEIADGDTRFVRFAGSKRRALVVGVLGAALGYLLGRRRGRTR
jgi:uncharacterized spore protein YtfJ